MLSSKISWNSLMKVSMFLLMFVSPGANCTVFRFKVIRWALSRGKSFLPFGAISRGYTILVITLIWRFINTWREIINFIEHDIVFCSRIFIENKFFLTLYTSNLSKFANSSFISLSLRDLLDIIMVLSENNVNKITIKIKTKNFRHISHQHLLLKWGQNWPQVI